MRWFQKTYKWDGYWETGYLLKHFDANEETEIEFMDSESSDLATPTPAQIKAATFIINNQKEILNALCQQFLTEYDEWKEIYEEHLPEMKTPTDVLNKISINKIYIDMPEKEGCSYVGYSGGCEWDEEHGLGFYTHKLEVLKVGESAIGFSWYPDEDDDDSEDEDHVIEPPKQYEPDPVHGLKPSQHEANQGYYYRLIEGGFNEQFIEHFTNGDIHTETRTGYVNMSFLERACQFANEEIVDFLLSHNPVNTENCMKQAAYKLNLKIIKSLVAYGVDINERDNWFQCYPIQNAVGAIGTRVRNNASEEEYENGITTVKWMLENGANPEFVLHPEREYDGLEYAFKDEDIRKRMYDMVRSFCK